MKRKKAEENALRHFKAKLQPARPAMPDLLPFSFTDSGNGDRLIALYGSEIRYCFAFRKWLRWDGARWATDDTGHALKFAKKTMVKFLEQAIEKHNDAAEKFARSSLDNRRLQSALVLAQPELPITPAELDRAANLINFANGVVDLRTGLLRPHDRANYITKMIAGNYRADAECPGWLKFLNAAMGGGPDAGEAELERAGELVNFIHLGFGYSMTGNVSEKVMFVCHGGGDNGKTSMLSIVRDLIPEYAATVGLDVLTAKDDSNNVAAARAGLFGARFAMSSETEEGQRMSAAKLKRICQGSGGMIEACRKYENPIAFPESHKLWIDANHKPDLPASDRAAWARLRLIPFLKTVAKADQDRGLKDRLIATEAEGILAWLVAGAKRWYAEGLPVSKTVDSATSEWREETNRLHAFVEERTQADAKGRLGSRDLYNAYKRWAEDSNERYVLSIQKFTKQMEAMGYESTHTEEGNIWPGIRFRQG